MSNKNVTLTIKRESDEKDFYELKSLLEQSGTYSKKIKNIDVIMIANEIYYF